MCVCGWLRRVARQVLALWVSCLLHTSYSIQVVFEAGVSIHYKDIITQYSRERRGPFSRPAVIRVEADSILGPCQPKGQRFDASHA